MTNDEKKVLKFLSYFLPSTFILVGLPLAFKWIAPNDVYGFRIAKTFASPEAWYSVNFIGGVSFIIAGMLSILLIHLVYRRSRTTPLVQLIMSLAISTACISIAIMTTILFG